MSLSETPRLSQIATRRADRNPILAGLTFEISENDFRCLDLGQLPPRLETIRRRSKGRPQIASEARRLAAGSYHAGVAVAGR